MKQIFGHWSSRSRLVLFNGDGRLGNQAIQLAFLVSRFPSAVLVLFSMSSICNVFVGLEKRYLFLPLGKTSRRAIRWIVVPLLIRPLFRWLRIGEYVYEPQVPAHGGALGASGLPHAASGALPLSFVDGGYYQNMSSLLEPADFKFLKIKPGIMADADSLVLSMNINPAIIMHVRRTDYLMTKTYGLDSITLGPEYYRKALTIALGRFASQPDILVVTDDVSWCRESFRDIEGLKFASESEGVDFALLTLFPIVIVSNSTFSLVAACISQRAECIIAPRYWFGRSVGEWYPPHICASGDKRFTYV